ncbi:MAG: hypothetical protein WAK48_07270 [Candidatus Acidiferrum sp.]|jgi:hypothetical protein
MRFVKVLQFFCLLLVAVALFGGEVVESACFVNDVSNDYIQAPAPPAHQFAKKAPANMMSQNSIKVAEELILNLAVAPSIAPAPSSASNLLRLLSIQRK